MTHPFHRSAAVVLFGLCLGCFATAEEETPKPKLLSTEVTGDEVAFLKSAAREMLLQANLAEVAVANAESEAIKEFASSVLAQQVVDEHTLAGLAGKKGVPIPDELDASQTEEVGKLEKLTGLKFDKVYLDALIASRQDLIERYEPPTRSQDPDIKEFAADLVSGFREHLLFARRLMGTGGRANSIPSFRTSVGEH